MKDKPTYEELEKQIIELEKQNEILKSSKDSDRIAKRKQSEKAIAKSNDLLTSVIKQAPFAIHILEGDFHNIKVVIANQESARIMGEVVQGRSEIDTDIPETLSTRFFTIDGKQEIPLSRMPSPRAFNGEVVSKEEFLFRHPDGTKIMVEVSASPVYDASGKIRAVTVTFHDITERKQVEKIQTDSELQFRSLSDASMEGIGIVQYDQILIVNKKVCELFGYDQNEMIGKTFLEFVAVESRELALKNFKDKFKEPFEIVAIRKNGSKFLAEVCGKTIEFKGSPGRVIAIRDITERKQAEKALKESEEKYRSIFESFPDIYFRANNKGIITELSPSVLQISGFRPDELIGKSVTTVYQDPVDRINLLKELKESGRVTDYELKLQTKDKGAKFASLCPHVTIGQNGEINGIEGVIRDISERIRVEKELYMSETLYRNLFEKASDAIFMMKGNTFNTCNEATINIFGCDDKKDIIEHSPWEFSPPNQPDGQDSKKKAMIYINAALKGKPQNFYWKHIKKDGTPFDTEVSLSNLILKDITYLQAIVRDITERKQAEAIKSIQFEITRFVLNTKNLSEFYEAVRGELGRIIKVENFYVAYYDEKTDQLSAVFEKDSKDQIPSWPSGKSLTGKVIKEQKPLILKKAEILNLANTGEIELIGTRAEVWLGVPLLIGGGVSGVLVVQDYDNPQAYNQAHLELLEMVSKEMSICIERKQAEEALKESEEKLKISYEQLNTTLNALPDLLFEIDKETIIYDYRASNSDLLFLPPSEFLGKAMKEILPKEASEKILFAIEKAAEYGNYSGIEYSLQLKNGINWFDISIAEKKHLNYYRYILLVRNITDRKKAVQALKENEAQLRELNATKDKFFSIIAHDLKSPFNAILGFSDLLVEQIQERDYGDIEKYVGIIQKSSQQAMDLLLNLMEWSQSQTGKMEFNPVNVDVVELINKITELLSFSALQKAITISKKLPDNIQVSGDKDMISTILRNLISNSIKFTHPDGTIVISSEQKQNELMICVSDSGVGIKKENISKLFCIEESISTIGTQEEKGTGLGLILCKEFVEKLGGNIWVESEEGNGSTFYFTLPYTSEKIKDKNAKNEDLTSAEVKPMKKLNILIVDDDETSEELLMIAVQEIASEITSVRTGTEAATACRDNPDIDLVLMDIAMPGINGYEATRQIRKFNKNVIIIAQTAFALQGDKEKALNAGCNDYISKPVNRDTLLSTIDKNFNEITKQINDK